MSPPPPHRAAVQTSHRSTTRPAAGGARIAAVALSAATWLAALTACAEPHADAKGAPVAAPAPTPGGPAALTDGQPATVLGAVAAEVARVRAVAQRHPVVVFDLDATLFDNRERTRAILAELALEPDVAKGPHGAALRGLRTEQVVYALADTLKAVGITDAEFVKRAVAWWVPRFFGEYAVHDRVTPGGPAYVRRLYDAGAFVVYLSGRDRPRMLNATVQSLAISGYPIGLDRTQLILKPGPDTDDEVFKAEVMGSLARLGTVVASFDNEPGNVNLMRKAFPTARVVFLETMHAPGAPAVGPGIERVPDFRAGL